MMMMIKRIMILGAWAFVACCPIANSFVYRFSPMQHTFNTNSMLGRKQRGEVGKTIGVPSGKTIDGAGVGRSSGAVAIEEKLRIPRVPSALDPEGITRRVDSPLHILGKGGDGEDEAMEDGDEDAPTPLLLPIKVPRPPVLLLAATTKTIFLHYNLEVQYQQTPVSLTRKSGETVLGRCATPSSSPLFFVVDIGVRCCTPVSRKTVTT
ncbi:unnamed protein product [Ectocarpus sp. CCAP 1310/34]|nr:unnamed protein product [Ectocarpus sp. CCAP 1310/34]